MIKQTCMFFHSSGTSGGKVCSTVCAVEDDVSQCASSAVNGYKAWSGLSCYQRAKVLLRYNRLTLLHISAPSALTVSAAVL